MGRRRWQEQSKRQSVKFSSYHTYKSKHFKQAVSKEIARTTDPNTNTKLDSIHNKSPHKSKIKQFQTIANRPYVVKFNRVMIVYVENFVNL